MKKPKVILEAELSRKLFNYYFVVALISIIGIPFILLWIIPFILTKYEKRYFESHSLTLTDVGVTIKRGVWDRSETNIPLDRITDVTIAQGPIMRRYGMYRITVETAGQTKLAGAANLVGVIDSHEFRRQVLERIEIYKASQGASAPAVSSTPAKPVVDEQTELLKDILGTLKRIEKQSK